MNVKRDTALDCYLPTLLCFGLLFAYAAVQGKSNLVDLPCMYDSKKTLSRRLHNSAPHT